MKIKTADLTDAALEWAVDVARTGRANLALPEYQKMHNADQGHASSWAYGGPIIEGERIWLQPEVGKEGTATAWYAVSMHNTDAYGPTPLIAAMRCYVASQLGDEVDVPDELINQGETA